MSEQYFVADADSSAPSFVLGTDERALWSGHCAVAEYAFDQPASLPRWTLPEETEVVVTDQRVLYRGPGAPDTGELRWPWPQHLRVQPGSRDTGRQATVTQIQLVCAGPGGSFPALVFAGGDLDTVRDADRLANTLRQAIARYRVENAAALGVAAPQVRMLSRLVIGPEFNNFQGGEGQTVSLIGAVSVDAYAAPAHAAAGQAAAPGYAQVATAAPGYADVATAAPGYADVASAGPGYADVATAASGYADVASAGPGYADVAPVAPAYLEAGTVAPAYAEVEPAYTEPAYGESVPAAPAYAEVGPVVVPVVAPEDGVGRSYERTTRIPVAPQRETWSARPADASTLNGHPDLDARAAELAARVASLVAGGNAPLGARPLVAAPENQTNLSAYLDVPPANAPRPRGAADDGSDEISGRAESVRRTAARFAGNAARGRGSAPRYDGEVGSSGRGSHRQG
ncbi:translation initiation factor 2 [Actinoplanes sp. M2I2]|uniref:translation initiation factor 2 n=1 Tax=Actinoplanes sp. M2I2 TaxID=1734444 RepID=UPI00202229FB|nr:translation initiation factor 2 [Actinoplanes sp. M2I2]